MFSGSLLFICSLASLLLFASLLDFRKLVRYRLLSTTAVTVSGNSAHLTRTVYSLDLLCFTAVHFVHSEFKSTHYSSCSS